MRSYFFCMRFPVLCALPCFVCDFLEIAFPLLGQQQRPSDQAVKQHEDRRKLELLHTKHRGDKSKQDDKPSPQRSRQAKPHHHYDAHHKEQSRQHPHLVHAVTTLHPEDIPQSDDEQWTDGSLESTDKVLTTSRPQPSY